MLWAAFRVSVVLSVLPRASLVPLSAVSLAVSYLLSFSSSFAATAAARRSRQPLLTSEQAILNTPLKFKSVDNPSQCSQVCSQWCNQWCNLCIPAWCLSNRQLQSLSMFERESQLLFHSSRAAFRNCVSMMTICPTVIHFWSSLLHDRGIKKKNLGFLEFLGPSAASTLGGEAVGSSPREGLPGAVQHGVDHNCPWRDKVETVAAVRPRFQTSQAWLWI